MITLNIFCDLFWLWWLLPLLLGALLTWLYWKNKYNTMVSEYDGKIKGLNGRISGLEGDLAECGNKRADLEGDLALTKGRMREMEADMNALKAKAAKGSGSKGSASVASSLAASGGNKAGSDTGSSSADNTGAKEGDKGGADAKISPLTSDGANSKGSVSSGGSGTTGSGDAAASSGSDLSNITSSLAGGAAGAAITGSGDTPSSSDSTSSPNTDAGGSKKAAGSSKKYTIAEDNLQIVEGIGPKMESVLKENGVNTHASLAGKSLDELQAILNKYGDKYKIIDPKDWATQARYASDGDYDGLISLQKQIGGKNSTGKPSDSKLEKYLIRKGFIKAFKQDDLKAIEGIGPATEKLLHSNGIMTWRDLANTEASAVKAMLTAAGSRFALGDPTTWPKQAEMAADGEFDKLREYQDFLDGGKG